jgi:hypothetical protein
MRFELEHPTNSKRTATYGFDHGMGGFFVEVREGRKLLKCYDPITEGYDRERPLDGALKFLAQFDFFSEEDMYCARDALLHCSPEEVEPELRLAAEVTANFKTASD